MKAKLRVEISHRGTDCFRKPAFFINSLTKAATTKGEAEKFMALGYEFHYRTQDCVDLFRKRVIVHD